MQKTFVLDTNVLLHSAESITSFKDNNVVLPMAVIEELDKFKKFQDERGRNARKVIRTLDSLREKGHLSEGVKLGGENDPANGLLSIISCAGKIDQGHFDMAIPDHRILWVAYELFKQKKNIIFITKDINLRLKADALGIKVMDFEREKIDSDTLYTGCRSFEVSSSYIDALYKEKTIAPPAESDIFPNEFVLLQDADNPKHSALARFQSDGNLHPAGKGEQRVWNIMPRNKEQRMALDLLLDPDVKLVTLVGRAGTGKTLLALAAAMELVLHQHLYEKILVSRPIVPLGNDIGYLPGDKDEKLSHWMGPIFDNLDYLMHGSGKNGEKISSRKTDDLIGNHIIELEALTYIRGRSIPRQFIIVDEAQNLTPHEVKTIISRAGEGSKMVLTGDPNQIDNPYLDSASNGLSCTIERLKNLDIYGHVTLHKSERSHLAAIAAEYL